MIEGSIEVTDLGKIEGYVSELQDVVAIIAADVFEIIKPPLLKEIRTYPPPRPRQRYKRTFRLKKGWTLRYGTDNQGAFYEIMNRVQYTHYVQGRLNMASIKASVDSQAWMHKGRWVPASKIVKHWFNESIELFKEQFDDALSEELRRLVRTSKKSKFGL